MGKYNSITINSVLAVLITLLQLFIDIFYSLFIFSLSLFILSRTQSWVYCPADDLQLGAHALAEVSGSTCSGGKHSMNSNLKRLRTSLSKPVAKSSFQLDGYTVSLINLFSTCHDTLLKFCSTKLKPTFHLWCCWLCAVTFNPEAHTAFEE